MSELKDHFVLQKRYGQSIRRIIKKKLPKYLPPLKEERSIVSKSVIIIGGNDVEATNNNQKNLNSSVDIGDDVVIALKDTEALESLTTVA